MIFHVGGPEEAEDKKEEERMWRLKEDEGGREDGGDLGEEGSGCGGG